MRRPLAAHQNVKGQRIGIRFPRQRGELPGQPLAKDGEEGGRLVGNGMVEFRQLVAQGAGRVAMRHDLRAVCNQDRHEAQDPIGGRGRIALPGRQQGDRVRPALGNHRGQDLILRLEVELEVAALQSETNHRGERTLIGFRLHRC